MNERPPTKEEWLARFAESRSAVVEAADEYWATFMNCVEDAGEVVPHPGFWAATYALSAWAAAHNIEAGALTEFGRLIEAARKPGPPHGPRPTEDAILEAGARAMHIRERIVDAAVGTGKPLAPRSYTAAERRAVESVLTRLGLGPDGKVSVVAKEARLRTQTAGDILRDIRGDAPTT